MSIKSKIRKYRNQYIINKVKNIAIPDFKPEEAVRFKCLLSGKIQHRGLRLEVEQLVHRLRLTGFIKNNPLGDIELEIQGPENKVLFLIDYILKIKRISIREKQEELILIDPKENTFEII
jgi:acylphosphatase